MPIFMDRHDIPGVSAEDVAEAHQKDLLIQGRFDCRALTYWFDEERGMAFCLIEAPNKQAVQDLHDHAHGLIPNQVIEVEPDLVASFLGRIEDPVKKGLSGAGIINDPAFRCVMGVFIDGSAIFEFGSHIVKIKSKIRKEFKRHMGLEVIPEGEGLLASFEYIDDAVRCALFLQDYFDSSKIPIKNPLQIGLAAGIPVSGDKRFFGPTVKLAKRLGMMAKSGQVISSAIVSEQLSDMAAGSNTLPEGNIFTLNPGQEEIFNLLIEILEEDGCNAGFGINALARKTGMSKSKLYRKTKKTTGYSPNDFIKEYRLKMAQRFINKQDGNISEIAYSSGFSSLSYFSRCFQDRFGILPSIYANAIA
ncbi:AraC-type DNA-binding protein [Cyclobacterium lianum]|uniref:AraC-type DNA-binding protein n=1 Tax=Cyclobacterium lianum TaxID=388280 RepID=A0A1M7PRK7_9BACT|nr:nickel-binding protein [Cyclobacterium lianum]SHN19986.1 AraC-type DNA-binding protein [Cyclobacterium lianum]